MKRSTTVYITAAMFVVAASVAACQPADENKVSSRAHLSNIETLDSFGGGVVQYACHRGRAVYVVDGPTSVAIDVVENAPECAGGAQ